MCLLLLNEIKQKAISHTSCSMPETWHFDYSTQWRLQGGFWGFWKLVSLPIRPDMSLATLSEAGMITAMRKATG